MIKVLLIYFLIGWIFGFANFLLALTEKYNRDYSLSTTMAIVLYWPIVVVTNIISFLGWVKRKHNKGKNGR